MKALIFDRQLRLQDIPVPQPGPDEVLIKISKAGICNTDIEITRGYMGFTGVLGHEFIGYIQSPDSMLHGKRVTAEINFSCDTCELCTSGRGRHCSKRTVLGISGRDGVFAEYVAVPFKNVIFIPDSIPDHNAIFIEPLAAALQILEQVVIAPHDSVLVIGDGKLAQLISIVLLTTGCNLTVNCKHDSKIKILQKFGINTCKQQKFPPQSFDIVVEASGSPDAFFSGLTCVKPRGTFVLKSTYADDFSFNPASIVINEINIVGSRCGSFKNAIDFLLSSRLDLSTLISGTFKLESAETAFQYSQQKDVLKVIIDAT